MEGRDLDDTSFAAPGVSRRELRKLSRGEHAPTAQLDVHGMTSAQAIEAVTRFIDRGHGVQRSVAIVHGRGLHSEGGVAILRSRVRACLRAHPAVLAYTEAPRGEGGSGAVWVLLRR